VPSSRTLTFSDPFPYQKTLRLADVELLPTTKGDFRAELTQINLDKLWMQCGSETLPHVVAGTVKPVRRGILFNSKAQVSVYRGMNVCPGGIIVHNGDFEHRRNEPNCNWGSMSLAHDDFNAACKTITGSEFVGRALEQLVRPDLALTSRLLDVHATIGQIAKTTPDILQLPRSFARSSSS
jgi:hypothetical protein